MKIVNLNNYEENDGLRDKLRQRMDAHEPELSDSVWDRIHHEMDQRDANRKKRFLWWFSSVAVVLLTSGIIAFSVLDTAQPQTIAQNTTDEVDLAPLGNSTEKTTVFPKDISSSLPPKKTNRTTNNGGTVSTNTPQGTSIEDKPLVPPPPFTNGGDAIPNREENPSQNTNSIDGEKLETKDTPEIIETESKEAEPAEATETVVLTETEGSNKEEEEKKAKKNTKTAVLCGTSHSRWFVGTQFGLNYTYRTVSDINPAFFTPNAKDRNDYERAALSTSYGVEVGFFATKNLFIKSGVGVFNTAETVNWDVKERQNLSNQSGVPLPNNYGDSVATGNSNSMRNSFQYVQIPLEIGYSRNITNKWGLYATTGIALNLLQKYEYNFYEKAFGSEMTNTEKTNSNDMYKNYVMWSGSLGAQYSICNNWVANFGLNYRRAITSATDKKYEVDVRPYSIGATAGIAYRF